MRNIFLILLSSISIVAIADPDSQTPLEGGLPPGTVFSFGNDSKDLTFGPNENAKSFGTDPVCNVYLSPDSVGKIDLSNRKFKVASPPVRQYDSDSDTVYQGTIISVNEVQKDGTVVKGPIDYIQCAADVDQKGKACAQDWDISYGQTPCYSEMRSNRHPTISDFQKAFLQSKWSTEVKSLTGYTLTDNDKIITTLQFPPATSQNADANLVTVTQ